MAGAWLAQTAGPPTVAAFCRRKISEKNSVENQKQKKKHFMQESNLAASDHSQSTFHRAIDFARSLK